MTSPWATAAPSPHVPVRTIWSSAVRLNAPPAASASTIRWTNTGIAYRAGSTAQARMYRSARVDQSDVQQARTAVTRSAGSTMPRKVSNWPAKEAGAVSSQRAEERTASWAPAVLARRVRAASSAAPTAGSSGTRVRPSLTRSASRRASGGSAAATCRAVSARSASATCLVYAPAARQTPSGTGNPARWSRARVAALGPTRSAVAAPASARATARSGHNEEPQHAVGRALVGAERRRRLAERVGAGDEAVQLHGAGRHQPDGGLEVRGDERARAHEREFLVVHRKGRELGHRFVADRVEQERAAGAQHVHGRTQEVGIAGGVDHHVRATAIGQTEHLADDVAFRRVDRRAGAHALRQLTLPRAPRDGDERAGARELGEPRVEETGGALAQHDHRVAGGDAHTLLSVAYGRERLDEGGGLEADPGWQRMQIALREDEVLGQGAVQLAAEQPGSPAEILVAPHAAVAGPAGDDRVDHDPRPDGDAGVRAHGLDDTGGLVAQHHRVVDAGMAAGVDREVRVADRGGGDANNRLAAAGHRPGSRRDLEAAGRFQDGRPRQVTHATASITSRP